MRTTTSRTAASACTACVTRACGPARMSRRARLVKTRCLRGRRRRAACPAVGPTTRLGYCAFSHAGRAQWESRVTPSILLHRRAGPTAVDTGRVRSAATDGGDERRGRAAFQRRRRRRDKRKLISAIRGGLDTGNGGCDSFRSRPTLGRGYVTVRQAGGRRLCPTNRRYDDEEKRTNKTRTITKNKADRKSSGHGGGGGAGGTDSV